MDAISNHISLIAPSGVTAVAFVIGFAAKSSKLFVLIYALVFVWSVSKVWELAARSGDLWDRWAAQQRSPDDVNAALTGYFAGEIALGTLASIPIAIVSWRILKRRASNQGAK